LLVSASSLAAIAGMALPASAVPVRIQVLVREGDFVPGVGNITRVDNVAVNSAGDWIVEADTDNADTTADVVVLKNGALFLQENQSLPAPAGSNLSSVDAFDINNNADHGWNWFLRNTGGSNNDSGVFFNQNLVIQEGAAVQALGITPGTPYIGFFDAVANDDSDIFLIASIDDPAITSTVDRALIILSPAQSGWSETLISKESDILPGQTEAVADFGTGPHSYAFSNTGQAFFFADLNGDAARDGAFYLSTLAANLLIAQESLPSGIQGRNYLTLSSKPLDMNNLAGLDQKLLFRAALDGDAATNEVLIKREGVTNSLVAQEGDALAAFAPFQLTSFGTGPVFIDDSPDGHAVWAADWNDPDTTRDQAIMRDQEILVQEGVTSAEGSLVVTVRTIEAGYRASTNGRHIIARVEIQGPVGPIDAAILISLCAADFNGDNQVDFFDYLDFVAAFDAEDDSADFNGDNQVDFFDYLDFASAFDEGCD
jgi:hypothetical protein